MQVTNEYWSREDQNGRTELAVVLFTEQGVVVTYTNADPRGKQQQIVRTEEFDGRSDGDAEVIEDGLKTLGFRLVMETRFLV